MASQGKTLEKRETMSLIGSDKVEGTPVYRSNGERVGQIERVMIDKLSGKVAYAVMSFGGFMGIGEDYYPRAAAQGRAEIFQARNLGLVRPRARRKGVRLLPRRPVLGVVTPRNSRVPDVVLRCVRDTS
jgi:PRC-barrel domain